MATSGSRWRISQACFDIGLHYCGKGDYNKSFKYFEKNGLWASGFLANHYYWGLGVDKDLRKAKQYDKWYKRYGGILGLRMNDSDYFCYNDAIKRDVSSLFQKEGWGCGDSIIYCKMF